MKNPRRRYLFPIGFRRAAFALGVGLALLAGFSPSAEAQTSAAAPPAPVLPAEKPPVTEFVRYVEAAADSDGVARLETAVRSYRRGDQRIDLVSVIHIADPDYYVAMNEVLARYEVVLYEMVGGPVREREANAAQADPAVTGIKVIHGLLQRMLALEYQTDGIDYSPLHFAHADVDWEEYEGLMASRDQSMATLFQRAMAISMSGQAMPGLPTSEADSAAMLGGLLRAVTSGDANGLKRLVGPMLGEAESLVSLIAGDDGTVIITERTKVVLREVGNRLRIGNKTLGIFYGAGHMPDLEARLLAEGFQAGDVRWMTAWEIAASPSPPRAVTAGASGPDGTGAGAPQSSEDAVVNALGFLGGLLQDQELMRSMVDGVRAFTESGPESLEKN